MGCHIHQHTFFRQPFTFYIVECINQESNLYANENFNFLYIQVSKQPYSIFD